MKICLDDKKAVVLSSSRGLGYSSAKCLLQAGADVLIHGASKESVEKAKDDLISATGVCEQKIQTVSADLYSESDVNVLVEAVSDFEPSILVLNSGGPKAGGIFDLDTSSFDTEVNMITNTSKRLIDIILPIMKESGSGRIINISSIGLIKPIPSLMASNAARGYLHGLMIGLVSELGPFNITLNTVCPGIILTDRQINLAKYDSEKSGVDYKTVLANKANSIPLKKLGEPDDIGALITFLSSPFGSYINGQKISVDGGLLGVF